MWLFLPCFARQIHGIWLIVLINQADVVLNESCASKEIKQVPRTLSVFSESLNNTTTARKRTFTLRVSAEPRRNGRPLKLSFWLSTVRQHVGARTCLIVIVILHSFSKVIKIAHTPPSCVVLGCYSNYKNGPEHKAFHIPAGKAHCQKWIHTIHRKKTWTHNEQ